MIVVLDTNALHGDVYAEGGWAETLFAAAADREDLTVKVPSVVVEELVRQFPGRLDIVKKGFAEIKHDVFAIGLRLPQLPDLAKEVDRYRNRLESNLDRPGVEIAGPPRSAGKIAEWVAKRRMPIPGGGEGVVDAQIWLTALESAVKDQVFLITNNSDDFANPDDKSRLHKVLQEDMSERGLDEDQIVLKSRILDFNEEYLQPLIEANKFVQEKLADPEYVSSLTAEIEDAMAWMPLSIELPSTAHDTEVENAQVQSFELDTIEFIRADSITDGTSGTIRVLGNAMSEIFMFKGDAYALSPDSGIKVHDFDWNESMAAAEGEIAVWLLVRLTWGEGFYSMNIDEVNVVEERQVFDIVDKWVNTDATEALEGVAEAFDNSDQKATAVRLRRIKSYFFAKEHLVVNAEFNVDYRNRIDSDDVGLSAENVTTLGIDLIVTRPEFEHPNFGTISPMPGRFLDTDLNYGSV